MQRQLLSEGATSSSHSQACAAPVWLSPATFLQKAADWALHAELRPGSQEKAVQMAFLGPHDFSSHLQAGSRSAATAPPG